MKRQYSHTHDIVYTIFSQTIGAVERLTNKLNRVNGDIVEDVEYVAKTLKWIVGIKELVEELEG